ncbi:bacteriohemerythrin [Reyranella sp.]|jgi:hemerythrin-like metal-binding protein|uniref:bacteriohemerythrin n=1 Tax=Reyranella sp. TaxID=1929291 RepID=UPI002F92080D
MSLLRWSERYRVGIAAVDHEHRELIDLINRLHDAFLQDRGNATVEGLFGDLLAAISSHFALEERFMREHGYDGFAAHKEDHERLLDEIREIMDDFRDHAELAGQELTRRLDAWFSRHFETHDARLHSALWHPRT